MVQRRAIIRDSQFNSGVGEGHQEPSARLGAVPFNTSSNDLRIETVRIETASER